MQPQATASAEDSPLEALTVATLRRFVAQNALAPLDAKDEVAFARGLRAVGDECGWANVLSNAAGELSGDQVSRWVAGILSGLAVPRPDLANVAKQLIKGCLQPAPSECRLSYAEKHPSGRCRRQERATAVGRVSGTHCVDCPYWVELTEETHRGWLAPQWHDGAAAFDADAAIFLPEDFRRLRLAAMRLGAKHGPGPDSSANG